MRQILLFFLALGLSFSSFGSGLLPLRVASKMSLQSCSVADAPFSKKLEVLFGDISVGWVKRKNPALKEFSLPKSSQSRSIFPLVSYGIDWMPPHQQKMIETFLLEVNHATVILQKIIDDHQFELRDPDGDAKKVAELVRSEFTKAGVSFFTTLVFTNSAHNMGSFPYDRYKGELNYIYTNKILNYSRKYVGMIAMKYGLLKAAAPDQRFLKVLGVKPAENLIAYGLGFDQPIYGKDALSISKELWVVKDHQDLYGLLAFDEGVRAVLGFDQLMGNPDFILQKSDDTNTLVMAEEKSLFADDLLDKAIFQFEQGVTALSHSNPNLLEDNKWEFRIFISRNLSKSEHYAVEGGLLVRISDNSPVLLSNNEPVYVTFKKR